ncbi:hypothetical protein CYMTET_27225 [Cymbomonas tetramitiformis]|uniref:Uncharacterized protein n=1 Tax=Cymbomonas tetramitiformis TaxID=36881 RepID=A0AAE0FQ80_9CHLO|nr:hypothetical protein CYMTET_27225 [Cymbomonas tetramitiformis]
MELERQITPLTPESERSKLGECPRRVFCREKWKTQEVPALDASFFAEHSLRSWECGLERPESLCSSDRTGHSTSVHPGVVSSQEHARQLVVKVPKFRGEHGPVTERGRQQHPSRASADDLRHSADASSLDCAISPYYRRLNDLLNTGWVRYCREEQSTAERGEMPVQRGGEGTEHAPASPRTRVPACPPSPPMSERGDTPP